MSLAIDSSVMWKARHIRCDGEITVQAPGTALEDGNSYYLDDGEGSLRCAFCAAAVGYQPARGSTAGRNLPGVRAHFRLAAGELHEPVCAWLRRPPRPPRKGRPIDRAKGLRVHLNMAMYSGLAPTLPQPWPLERERSTIYGIGDLVDLMQKTPALRLKDSLVVFGNNAVPWEDFLVRYGRHQGQPEARYIRLLRALQDGQPHACLMEIRTGKPALLHGYYATAESEHIEMGRDIRGRRQVIVPKVRLENPADDGVHRGMTQARAYLVLGVPQLETKEYSRSVYHRITVTVTDKRQLLKMSIEDIHAGLSPPDRPLRFD